MLERGEGCPHRPFCRVASRRILSYTTEARRAFAVYHAARTTGATAWVTCQGIEVWGIVRPSHSSCRTLARGLDYHDPDIALGAK